MSQNPGIQDTLVPQCVLVLSSVSFGSGGTQAGGTRLPAPGLGEPGGPRVGEPGGAIRGHPPLSH